jgi:hypothetical protein
VRREAQEEPHEEQSQKQKETLMGILRKRKQPPAEPEGQKETAMQEEKQTQVPATEAEGQPPAPPESDQPKPAEPEGKAGGVFASRGDVPSEPEFHASRGH